MFNVIDNGKYLHISVSGKLTHEDYIQFLIPTLEDAITKYGKLRLLLEVTNFNGWELQAAWDDFITGIKHRKDFQKIAIVGEDIWQEMLSKLFSIFVYADMKYFSEDDMERAINWIND
ncbi:STAS/SEC14 domain-containing protein [Thiotrichales bacterium 19X7-9]|nr:STAS/SEC14 domain-containing protein [Thiotrichales bacterium 19X7-9]TNF69633.1 MAG: STAS/SEC14 domain-containing protein [Gammaproteobacteria bacterium]UTW43404.1 STAS/SEC14 domain-containing protein [bacterium SCSIO 12844]